MKAIMISINPKWVAKILNDEKTIEIRKKFPKDYVGWVYIYCTKGKQYIALNKRQSEMECRNKLNCFDNPFIKKENSLNGKVVARFWCDKVEEIKRMYLSWNDKLFAWETETLSQGDLEIKACLSNKELLNYLAFKENGYAIHITKLEIFDKPKDAGEFLRPQPIWKTSNNHYYKSYQLSRVPQSWCYIEI